MSKKKKSKQLVNSVVGKRQEKDHALIPYTNTVYKPASASPHYPTAYAKVQSVNSIDDPMPKECKVFVDMCKCTQAGLKKALARLYINAGYTPVSKDGYLYCKGDIPVLLLAHMDTVHAKIPSKVYYNKTKDTLSAVEGIGGDDRCGIYMIMMLTLVRKYKCSVLFLEDEEHGCIGAGKFAASEYISTLDVNYMFEFDRMNGNDCVFYQCDNKEFEKFITDEKFYKTAYGSMSDISKIAPAAKLAAANLSCGYYKQHTSGEYVIWNEMLKSIDAAEKLILKKCDKPFEYVPKASTYTGSAYSKWSYYDDWEDYNSPSRSSYGYTYSTQYHITVNNVVYEVTGDSKYSALGKLIFEHPEFSGADVSGILHNTYKIDTPNDEQATKAKTAAIEAAKKKRSAELDEIAQQYQREDYQFLIRNCAVVNSRFNTKYDMTNAKSRSDYLARFIVSSFYVAKSNCCMIGNSWIYDAECYPHAGIVSAVQ